MVSARSNMKSGNLNEEMNEIKASNWNISPKKSGLKRCGKSCKPKRANDEKGDKREESFTQEEEQLIIKLHQAIGSRWPIIAQQIPGRTENEVKNYWNTKLRKKLTEMGIDHVTHRPFSQLLAEYGNMSQAGSRVRPFNREFQDSFSSKPDQGFITPQKIISSQDSNSSHDLLAQIQAITLVNDPSKNRNSSICSSSSSTSSSSFSWTDFLVEDPLFQGDESKNESILLSDFDPKEKEIPEQAVNDKILETLSTSSRSFVEAMVDRQNGMLLDFPELLEDSFFF